jgi:hypothetical protein
VLAAGAAGVWGLREEMRYLEPAEIQRPAYPLRRVDVPSIAERNGMTYFGKVKLRIYIPKSGEVDHVEVVTTTVPREIAEDTARRFAAARWEPGARSGRARRSVLVLEVDFPPPGQGVRSLTPEN